MDNNYTILLKSTLDQLNSENQLIGFNLSLICLILFFLIGNLSNILLFIKIKHYELISNKLHLINLIINNLLLIDIVLPGYLIKIINPINNDTDQFNLLSMYNQLIRAELCETESTLTLITFYCHLFNFLLFFINHKRIVLKTKHFYSNWFKLKKNLVLQNFDHQKTAKLNSGQQLETINQRQFDNVNYRKFSGRTINDIILINIRNFIFCFLTAWVLTLTLAVLNDFSDEQFSLCAIKYRLSAYWFKDLVFIDYSKKNDIKINDYQMNLNNQSNNADQFNNQTQITNHLNDLILKIKHFRSLPEFRYSVLLIQLIIILLSTLITIQNLLNIFCRNRTYRIVPQCYIIESNVLESTKNKIYFNRDVGSETGNNDDQLNSKNENNSINELNLTTDELIKSTNFKTSVKKLGKLKNERNELNLLRNVQQIINLKDDTVKETVKNNEKNNDLNEFDNTNKNESLPVANQTEDESNEFNHNCLKHFQTTNYLNDQQQFNNLKTNNYHSDNFRIVSASLIWRNHINQHVEQRNFAKNFIRIYLFFLITWLPFGLTIITTQLFTFTWNENKFNLSDSELFGDKQLNLINEQIDLNDTLNSAKLNLTIDSFNQTISNSTLSTITLNNTINSKLIVNLNNSTILKRSILFEKLKELNFKFINKLWFTTLIYSTFSAFFFQIINRQWLSNLYEKKLNNLVQFLKNH